MITTVIAAILFVCLVGITLFGRRVSRHLPEDQLSADSKDAVKLAMGFIATMTAVLLAFFQHFIGNDGALASAEENTTVESQRESQVG